MKSLLLTIFLLSSTPIANAMSETFCKAFTVFKEANMESRRGKRAILDIIENRMRLRNKTACQVMQEPHQFSFWRKGLKEKLSITTLTEFIEISNMDSVLDGNVEYFHNKMVKPNWSRRLRKVVTIGNHAFYKEKR